LIASFLKRVPWEKFFLLWFFSLLVWISLLWLHYGFTERILVPLACLWGATGLGLLWATTRPRWEKTHCSWCGARVTAKATRYDKAKGWLMVYDCAKCGHLTEKSKTLKQG
jgi:hypothetical protein